MASPFTFRCFDLVTAAQLDALPFTKVTYGEQVDAVGSFSATLNLTDPNVQALNWERSTRPNMSLVVVDMLGHPLQGFMVTNRKYKDKVLTVALMTVEQWFTQRIQAVDYSKPNPDAIYWGANPADPTVIAAQVIYDCLQSALTIAALEAQYCTIGGNGTVPGTRSQMNILINGLPPPNISGGSFTAVVTDSSDQLICYGGVNNGLNLGVVIGSEVGDGDVHIPSATNVTAVVQENAGSFTASAQASPVITTDTMEVLCNFHPRVGQLLVGAGIVLGSTITNVVALGGIKYTVTMSHNATASHTLETITITPWFRVTMNHNATVSPTSPISEAVAYSNTTGNSPTPEADWISTTLPKNQYQTADEILQTLSQMGHGVGFDYSFDVTYIENTTTPQITCNIWYPRQGTSSDNEANPVTLYIPKNLVISFEYDEDGTQQEVGIIETASKTGGVITGYQSNADLVTSTGYPVTEGVQTREKVNDATMLAEMAKGDLQLLQNPTATCTIVVPLCLTATTAASANGEVGVGIADFVNGDDLVFQIAPVPRDVDGNPVWGDNNDPRFPGGMNFEWRINQYTISIADDGVSTITFTCGIPPVTTADPPTPPPLS